MVRVYKEERHVEFEWLVGPVPIDDQIGKEVVSRFYTTIDSRGVFYTDSNGREMLKRVRNHRDTWNLHLQESVAGNYYPVTAKIAIEDDNYRMAILNDRSQGGSSMIDGSVELMVRVINLGSHSSLLKSFHYSSIDVSRMMMPSVLEKR